MNAQVASEGIKSDHFYTPIANRQSALTLVFEKLNGCGFVGYLVCLLSAIYLAKAFYYCLKSGTPRAFVGLNVISSSRS